MSNGKSVLSRRQFMRLGALGAIAWTAAACGVQPAVSGTPAAGASSTITPAQVTKILRNEDTAGFYIRYFRPFPAVDANVWRLDVAGLVGEARSFNLADLLAFPQATLEGRMKCVECWSARVSWGGFVYQTLADLVSPKPEARFLRFDCADGYWETVSIDEMKNPRALFVTSMNGQPLSDEHGAPLRTMMLWKYGYKSAKAITSISFNAEGGDGYWSDGGAYTIAGDIEAGFDHPLDLDDKTHRINGGEITEY